MKKSIQLLFIAGTLAFAGFAFSGCDGEDEPVPAYLHIGAFELESVNAAIHGSISHKITNVNAFLLDAGGNVIELGVLSPPVTIPVLNTGDFEINLDPVIKTNGNSLYLEAYPFYERFKANITLAANEETTVQPVTKYKSNAKFEFIEEFENAEQLFSQDRDDNPLTSLVISEADVFEGAHSGEIFLDSLNSKVGIATEPVFTLTKEMGRIFMEVNYKTEVPLEFGILALNALSEDGIFEFIVLPKEEWNKIYFDVSELISTANTTQFRFAMRAGLPIENGKFTMNQARIFLDNIKVVHF